MQAGARNLITDIDGLMVGSARDENVKTGVTVLTGNAPFVAGISVTGGAPGTRDTELLRPENTVGEVDALVLTGGSVFGLQSAAGVTDALAAQGRGFAVGPRRMPIVPTAVIFDLLGGGDKDWGDRPPYYDLGRQALAAADRAFDIGTAGAGVGATTALLKGGLGSASAVLPRGGLVGALVAVNAFGGVTAGQSRHFWAAPFELDAEFGGLGPASGAETSAYPVRLKRGAEPGSNTTIAIVATDLALTKAEAARLAIAAQDGIARAVWPAHTPLDGDTVFAVSTGARTMTDPVAEQAELGALAAATLSRAIARGVYAATEAPDDVKPTWRERFGQMA